MNSKYFRTVSIIMIIFGITGLIGGVASLSNATLGLATGIVNVINNLLLLVAGVIGTKAVKTGDEEKAALCKKLGLALIAVDIISIVISIIGVANASVPGVSSGLLVGMTIIGSIVSLVLPVLYFLGAKKLGE